MNELCTNSAEGNPSASSRTGRVARAGLIRKLWVAHLRPYTIATLIVFGWSACQPWNYAAAMAMPGRPSAPSRIEQDLARFDGSLRALRDAAGEIERKLNQAGELSPVVEKLSALMAEIAAADSGIEADFERVGKHLRTARLPREILKRHEQAVAAYRADLAGLRAAVEEMTELHADYQQAKDAGEATTAATGFEALKGKVQRLSADLRKKVREPQHRALDPFNLPHRGSAFAPRKPRLTPAAFAGLASAPQGEPTKRTAPVLGLGAAVSVPGPVDLGETVEVRLTPEIRALAAQLGNDPIRIYAYVRERVDFTPTYGSIQGAAGCLESRLCNDMDTASLLIALLRAAGVPARYAVGTVEVPIAQMQSWLGGFSHPGAALNFTASAGTPVTGLSSGSALVAVRLEHVWVEAFVDYVPSRGAVRGPGDTWVPLDASFKGFSVTPGVDLAAATAGFSDRDFFGQILDGATLADPDGAVTNVDFAALDQKLAELKSRVATYARNQGTPPKFGDLVGRKTVVAEALSALPASLPYEVLVRGASFAEVPDSLRHKLAFEITSSGSFEPDLSYQARLPALAGKRLTLGYSPATANDQATLESYVPTDPNATLNDLPTSLPAYLVQVRPELRIDGTVVATGAASTLGQRGQFSLVFSMPLIGQQRADNDITAGTYNAIVLNLGRVQDPAARRAASRALHDRLQAGNLTGADKDEIVGEFLHAAGLLYWSELEIFERVAGSAKGVAAARLPSEGIFTHDLKVSYLFGSPRTVSGGAAITDVDTNVQAVFARDGDAAKAVDFLAITGAVSSRAESAIYDQMVNAQPTGAGITAVSYLEAAARQGIPIFNVNRDNVARVLPKLQVSAAVKQDIQNAVNAGRVVAVPQREFAKDGFVGVGYIVFELDTGAGAYMISGGLAGGGFRLPHDPFVIFLLSMLLIGIGIFAAPLTLFAAIVAALGVLLIAYDYIATLMDISRDNPDLDPGAFEAIAGLLGAIALIGAGLAIAGFFFGAVLAIVLYAVYFAIISILVSGILSTYLGLFRNRTTLPSTASARLPDRVRSALGFLLGAGLLAAAGGGD